MGIYLITNRIQFQYLRQIHSRPFSTRRISVKIAFLLRKSAFGEGIGFIDRLPQDRNS